MDEIGCLVATTLENGEKSRFFAFYVKMDRKNCKKLYIFLILEQNLAEKGVLKAGKINDMKRYRF